MSTFLYRMRTGLGTDWKILSDVLGMATPHYAKSVVGAGGLLYTARFHLSPIPNKDVVLTANSEVLTELTDGKVINIVTQLRSSFGTHDMVRTEHDGRNSCSLMGSHCFADSPVGRRDVLPKEGITRDVSRAKAGKLADFVY